MGSPVTLVAIDPESDDAAVAALLEPHLATDDPSGLNVGRDGYARISPRPWNNVILDEPTDDAALWNLLHHAITVGHLMACSADGSAFAVASAEDRDRMVERHPTLSPDDIAVVTDGAALLAAVS
jgi:hypothetical protein